MQNQIDARELSQHQALALIDATLAQQGEHQLVIKTADQNLFLELQQHLVSSGGTIEEQLSGDDEQVLVVSVAGVKPLKSYVVGSDTLGSGDDVIGGKLMTAYFNVSAEYPQAARALFFMNTGVKLCIEDADTVAALKEIENKGTDVIVCGSCLDFFEVKEKLAVGRVGSMHDLLALYHGIDEVVTI
jgi:selenium metabolism protein YedF